MPFPVAITTPQYTSLRGSSSVAPRYAVNMLMCLNPNSVIFAARVNGTPTGTSFAQVTFDTVTTGAYTDLEIGERVYISSTSDYRNAEFVGIVRKAAGAATLYINETSAPILDNWYITVVHDFPIWDKLARYSAGVQYKFYDLTRTALKPVIYGLQSVYAGVCSGSPEKFTQAFAASAIAAESGASISSYAYTIGSGMTATAGSASTANVTIAFAPGHYWLKLVVTDSGGRAQTFRMEIFAVPSDYSSLVVSGVDNLTWQCDESGWNGSVNAFTGVASVLDNTSCVVFAAEEIYNGSAENIAPKVAFYGRLRTENDSTRSDEIISRDQSTRFELEGIASQLARIEHLPFTLITKASPTLWDEIKTMTLWRAMVYALQEHSTVLSLCSLTFDSTSNSFLYPALPTQGGNILSILDDIADSINAKLESAPTGELQIVRSAVYSNSAIRTTLTTVANFDETDAVEWQLQVEHVDTTGKVDAAGGVYYSSNGQVTPLLSVAPGFAQDYPEGTTQLNRQILVANVTKAVGQAELNQRTGDHFAASNPTPELTVTHMPGYRFLVPSAYQWYTWTIAAADNTTQRAYITTLRWLLKSVSFDYDSGAGDLGVQAVYHLETDGSDGDTVEVPTTTEIPDPLTPIPVDPPPGIWWPPPDIFIPTDPTFPPPEKPPTILPLDGNTVMLATENALYLTVTFASNTNPVWFDITPPKESDERIYHAVWSGFGKDVYCLVATDAESRVFYCADVSAAEPTWVDGEVVTSVYGAIRTTDTQGEIYLIPFTGTPTPTGCADRWSLYDGSHGIITARTSTTVTVQAALVSGGYYTLIQTSDDDECCYVNNVTLDSGGPISNATHVCGDPRNPATLVIAGTIIGHCANMILSTSFTPFTVTYELTDCP